MSCRKNIKELIQKCDLFNTIELLRYDDEPEYRTVTGGVCSIILISIFMAVFASSMLITLNKSQVSWTSRTLDSNNEALSLNTTIQGSQKFMAAITISGVNLNQGERLFDIFLTQKNYVNRSLTAKVTNLVPCNLKDWNISTDIVQAYQTLKFQTGLCIPPAFLLDIRGKYSSEFFNFVEIKVRQCNSSVNSSRPCANSSVIQSYVANQTNFNMNIFFINTLINPDNPEYISYYLQDRNYIPITLKTYSGLVNIFISNYQIETDSSILPYTDNKVETGGIVNSLGQVIDSGNVAGQYGRFVLKRSSTSTKISRSFRKIDQMLSYLGGLFGIIMTFMLFMKFYTEFSYEIDICGHLYNFQKKQSLESESFNFLYYLGYLFYLGLDMIGCKMNWQKMKRYDQCREEIKKQFDVVFLMERIIFLERSIKLLFEDHQFQGLHLREKLTIKEAEKLREHYKIKQIFAQNNIEIVNKRKESNECSQSNKNEKMQTQIQLNQKQNQFGLQFKRKGSLMNENESSVGKSKNQIYPQQFKPQLNQAIIVQEGENELSEEEIKRKEEHAHMTTSCKGKLKLLNQESLKGNLISQRIMKEMDETVLELIEEKTSSEGYIVNESTRKYEDGVMRPQKVQEISNGERTNEVFYEERKEQNSTNFVFLN